jgi:phospholipid/cholesterol/gamma-HCH transport system substrate-binding protein
MNQVRVGLVGLVLTGLVVALALQVGQFRMAMFGARHDALFAEAAGLHGGDDVRVAGMTVGKVRSVRLDRAAVRVRFSVIGVDLGSRTSAAIKSTNALGGKYLALYPAGPGTVGSIPLSRTSAPAGVTEALENLTTTAGELDVDQMAQSFDSVSAVLSATPEHFRGAIAGVDKLSQALANRDAELTRVFQSAAGVSKVLADRTLELTQLIGDGSAVMDEIWARRAAVHEILANTRAVAVQLTGLVNDNRATLRPALRELQGVIEILDKNEANLDFVLSRLGGFARSLGESVGSGPFYYAYLANLVPTNLAPVLPELMGKAHP